MVNFGSKNVLYINNFPVTRTEKEQYVATAAVPNIAASTVDDGSDETTAFNYQQWPYKPILLISNK